MSATPLDEVQFTRTDEFRISRIVLHDKYVSSRARYNVAIITLEESVTYSEHISPICLPNEEEASLPINIYSGNSVTMAGWKSTDALDANNLSGHFREVDFVMRRVG
jgi:hypothetical protein